MKTPNQFSSCPSRENADLLTRRSRICCDRWALGLCAVLIFCFPSLAQENRSAAILPNHFEIAVRTFFDFGPPFNYYDLYLVSSAANGASVERISLTPPGNACLVPAKIETVSASLNETIAALLGPTDPCAIPEKDLRRELKRCKKCLVFSGAQVVMQFQCGDHTRLIRSDILDRDMFDPAARTPEHTSWTMQLLARLEQPLGPGVMDKPMFTIPDGQEPSAVDNNSPVLRDLSAGKYDALFLDGSDKPSDLYRAALYRPPPPTVRLVSSDPIAPETFVPPKYPVLAQMASIEGVVSFTFDIDQDGGAKNIAFVSGSPLLRGAVTNAVASWEFPKGAAGQQVQATIEFKLNCHTHNN
jgi:hypothetical protein